MSPTLRELAKTVVVSQIAFWLDFGVLALLTEVAGLHYLLSAGISFSLGTTLSWALSAAWVFKLRRFSSKALEYALFLVVGVVGLALNEALIWLLTEPLGVHYLASKAIAAGLVFFWNFGARKHMLYR